MKKKAIEKVPYLKLPRVKKNKTVEYIAVTAVKEIGQEQHLFIEVYQNKKECKEIPVVRIVIKEKDFGTYFPETGEWSRRRITRNTWDNYGLIWRENQGQIRKTVNIMAQENILYSESDLKRIQKFLKGITVWNQEEWWEYIDRKQQDIDQEERYIKAARKRKRREQALEERQVNTPELPEERILKYADTILFHEEHYLYYKKHGVRATIACSNCGEITEGRWKPGQSFESQFEPTVDDPRMGTYGACPRCKAPGKYIPQGRVKSFSREREHLFLGQKYKSTGMVIRYIEMEKEWNVELIAGEKGLEMVGAYEKLTGIEKARVYFEPRKKVQKDYHKYNPYTGEDFWDDCNLSGINSISIREAHIMPETYENMKGTFIQYSALEEYRKAIGKINPADYLEGYIRTPQLEMLVKLGLIKTAKRIAEGNYGMVKDAEANRIDTFLGIRKERVKQLVKHQGDDRILDIMRIEKRIGKNWTEEQVEQLAEIGLRSGDAELLNLIGVQKLLNQVAKYAGCEYGTKCSRAEDRLKQKAITYLDYLNMRKELGYDMQNTVYLFPRDLEQAHREMVIERDKEEADKRIKTTEEKYPLIRKRYRRLRKRFYYKDKEFLIRPARSAVEIVMEGRILHHCVGRDQYLDRHNRGRSIILFLRNTKEPEIPYITVEIEPESLKIIQWYGEKDEKPDRERMQKWLDNYITRLKCGGIATGQEEEKGVAQKIAAYA